MPTFAYQAVDSGGKRTRGVENAASSGAPARTLETRAAGTRRGRVAGGERSREEVVQAGRRREVLEVTRALAALLPVGMPLARALNAASDVAAEGEVKAAIQDVRERVECGDTMSAALANYPPFAAHIGLRRAGERSGDLDSALARLATQLERDELLSGKITSAAIYLLILAIAGTGAVLVLMLFVLPRFVTLLEGAAPLPTSTALMLGISQALRRFWPALLLIPAAGAVISRVRTTRGARAWSRTLLTLPAVKTLRQYALSARFARLVGVLLGGGGLLFTASTTPSIRRPIRSRVTMRSASEPPSARDRRCARRWLRARFSPRSSRN